MKQLNLAGGLGRDQITHHMIIKYLANRDAHDLSLMCRHGCVPSRFDLRKFWVLSEQYQFVLCLLAILAKHLRLWALLKILVLMLHADGASMTGPHVWPLTRWDSGISKERLITLVQCCLLWCVRVPDFLTMVRSLILARLTLNRTTATLGARHLGIISVKSVLGITPGFHACLNIIWPTIILPTNNSRSKIDPSHFL